MHHEFATLLLAHNAVQLSSLSRFTWSSGITSPIYVDCRIVCSIPHLRNLAVTQMVDLIRKTHPNVTTIAGVATGGIALGALVAHELNLNFVYVRSEPKNHGMSNMIEGKIEVMARCVVIEDTVSTGKSILRVEQVLQKAGCEVLGLCSIFNYEFCEREIASLLGFTDLVQCIDEGKSERTDNAEGLKKWHAEQKKRKI